MQPSLYPKPLIAGVRVLNQSEPSLLCQKDGGL